MLFWLLSTSEVPIRSQIVLYLSGVNSRVWLLFMVPGQPFPGTLSMKSCLVNLICHWLPLLVNRRIWWETNQSNRSFTLINLDSLELWLFLVWSVPSIYVEFGLVSYTDGKIFCLKNPKICCITAKLSVNACYPPHQASRFRTPPALEILPNASPLPLPWWPRSTNRWWYQKIKRGIKFAFESLRHRKI